MGNPSLPHLFGRSASAHLQTNLPGAYVIGGFQAPGSTAELQGRRAAGWRAHVFRLRYSGVFLTRNLILDRPCPEGLVVSTECEGQWTCTLHQDSGGLQVLLPPLGEARVVKVRQDGCYLIAGLEWDEGRLKRWKQTWLCGPNWEAGGSALLAMDQWLSARYPRR